MESVIKYKSSHYAMIIDDVVVSIIDNNTYIPTFIKIIDEYVKDESLSFFYNYKDDEFQFMMLKDNPEGDGKVGVIIRYFLSSNWINIKNVYYSPNNNIYISYQSITDKEVENVAAIQVKNTSKQIVEYAQIELYNGDKKLVFEVSTLPANSSAVVMEKNKTDFNSSKGVTYGKSTVAYTDKLEKSSDIKYTTVDNNGIQITNKSKKDIGCVRIFYKYKSEDGYYIGGITYTAKVEDLKAGKSQTVYPSHYATEGGEIMMVKTYDE